MEDPNDKVMVMAMMEGLRLRPLVDSLSKNVLKTLSTFQSKAKKYIAAEELSEAKRSKQGRDDKKKEPDTRRTDYRDEARNKRPDHSRRLTNDMHPRTPPCHHELILPPSQCSHRSGAHGDQAQGIHQVTWKNQDRSSEKEQEQIL